MSDEKAGARVPWERVITFFPLFGAAVFACGAASYLGIVSGINRFDILEAITFTDISNQALHLGMAAVPGLLVGLIASSPAQPAARHIANKLNRASWWISIHALMGFSVSFVFSAILFFLRIVPFWGFVALCILPLTLGLVSYVWSSLSKRFPPEVALLGGLSVIALWTSFSVGAFAAFAGAHDGKVMVVQTGNEKLETSYGILLDRGVVLLEPVGFRLILWGDVRWLNMMQEAADKSLKPVTSPVPKPPAPPLAPLPDNPKLKPLASPGVNPGIALKKAK